MKQGKLGRFQLSCARFTGKAHRLKNFRHDPKMLNLWKAGTALTKLSRMLLKVLLMSLSAQKTEESTPVNVPEPNDEYQNAASIDLTQMDFSTLARLVDTLLACPNVSKRHRRDTIVNRLSDDIKSFASATKKF